MKKILVTYASKHNSTAEIATAIGEVLRQSPTLQVDVQAVEDVEGIILYNAIVLGSAVYMGDWQPTAADFLRKHERELAQRPVWLFSSGPTGDGDPIALMKGWGFPKALEPIVEQIKPRDITLFHGKLDPDNLNLLERGAIKIVHAPIGDFRDWKMIREWAAAIADALCSEGNKQVHNYHEG
jgi:menaquinone-dependent protoporphyrinogen oxidase